MLSKNIRDIRLSKGMSQVELASRLGVTKQSVSNWENDNIQPSIEMLVKISKVFMVSTDTLLDLDNKKYIEVTGLSSEVIAHIQQLIADIRSNK